MSPSDVAGRVHRTEFAIGEVVYLRLASERCPGMIASITLTPGCAIYRVGWGDHSETPHYAMELTRDWSPFSADAGDDG